MKYIVLTLVLFLYSNMVFSDSIACQFVMSDKTARNGFVLTPEKGNRKTMVIFINHRLLKKEETQSEYSYLVSRLLDEGISCCFYDNRVLHADDSTSVTTLFDMADDGSSVYKSLKRNRVFRGYKLGFIGASEGGASALISASASEKPNFLIQLVTNVVPQEKKDLQFLTIYSPIWASLFTDLKNGFGLSFYEFVALQKRILDDIKSSKIMDKENYARSLYRQYECKLRNHKDYFVPIITGFLHKQIDEDLIAPRLWWNAMPYYKKIKCPILFISARHDRNVLCSSNMVLFEKNMYKSGNGKCTSMIVNTTHSLLSPYMDHRKKEYTEKEIDKTDKFKTLDLVVEWLKHVIR